MPLRGENYISCLDVSSLFVFQIIFIHSISLHQKYVQKWFLSRDSTAVLPEPVYIQCDHNDL